MLRLGGQAYRKTHALDSDQRKAMYALEHCRTAVLGGHMDVCDRCAFSRPSYNSCRNRHCPKCQSLSQAKWIEKREARILPTSYFHVVLTLPSELRRIAAANRRVVFGLLFQAASRTLLELGRDEKRLGAQLGITAVLHTWTRTLAFHPHVHCLVTGGGLSADGRWVEAKARGRYLFPVKVVSRLFRGKFLALLEQAFLAGRLDLDPSDPLARSLVEGLVARLRRREWVVYAKRPFAGAEHVFRYLGRYTHRVGISNQRLRAVTDTAVTFLTKEGRSLTLSHEEFLARFLRHVLPSGFVKIRHYGLLAAGNVNTKLEQARALLGLPAAPTGEEQQEQDDWRDYYERLTGHDLRQCPRCTEGRLVALGLAEFARGVQPSRATSPTSAEPDT